MTVWRDLFASVDIRRLGIAAGSSTLLSVELAFAAVILLDLFLRTS